MLDAIFEFASYMPHGYCLLWDPWLVFLYVGSDALIVLAYFMIPFALLSFIRQRPDFEYRWLASLFAAFILLCGITHLFSILILWFPFYPLHGLVKLATGIVSCTTAAVLFRLVPTLVRLPSPSQLEAANTLLRSEIEAHEKTLVELRRIRASLEEQVAERTAELQTANEHLAVVSREAVHRARNLLAVVGSIARQTARNETQIDTFTEKLTARINALSTATAALLQPGDRSAAPLAQIAAAQLSPLLDTFGDRIAIGGPDVALGMDKAQSLTLALHELATNAVKYGALSVPQGRVTLDWSVARDGHEQRIVLTWRETGGPAATEPSADAPRGFGSTLLLSAVPTMLGGEAERAMTEAGLVYTLRFLT